MMSGSFRICGAALTYMVCLSRQKALLFMGQDFAQIREWSESGQLGWDLMEEPKHRGT